MQNDSKDITLSILYFLFSAAITGWFIGEKYALYQSSNQMLLSGSIASIKWIIQIIGAFLFLGNKKFEFIKRIAMVCLVGSVVLFSIYLIEIFFQSSGQQILVAFAVSVVTMFILYYRAVYITEISVKWFYSWACCLLITASVQLTSIFKLI